MPNNFCALTHALRVKQIREIDEGEVKEVSKWFKVLLSLNEGEVQGREAISFDATRREGCWAGLGMAQSKIRDLS